MTPEEKERIIREKIIPNMASIREEYVLKITRGVLDSASEAVQSQKRYISEHILDLYKPCTI